MSSGPGFLEQLNIKELQDKGTEFEVDLEKFYSSSDEDFDDEISNNFKDEFNKLKIEDEEIDLTSLTVDELKEKMTPVSDDKLILKMTTLGGTGIQIPEKSFVFINYAAYIENETKPFDSTYLRGQPHKFILGAGQVLYGLDIAVATMRKGEHAKFWIGCTHAYGYYGCPPRIPMNANIIYDIEVVNFIDYGDAIEFEEMLPDDQRNAEFQKVYAACKMEHKLGNTLFIQKKFAAASGRYARAIKLLEQVNAKDENEDEKRDKLLLKLYLNLSLMKLRTKKATRAIFYASRAKYFSEHLNENLAKVYYRLGQAYAMNNEFEKSRDYYLKAKDLEPYNKDISESLADLDNKARQYVAFEKNFCRNIFNSETVPSPPQVTEQFKKIIEDCISCFIKSDKTEYEFPSTFSESQIDAIKVISESHNLYFFEKYYNGHKVLKVKKNKE